VSQSHAEQLNQDLETLRSVVGDEFPFDKIDAKYYVAIGVAALVPAIVGLSDVRSPFLLLASAIPFLILVAACEIRAYRSTHPSKSCSRSKRLEYRPGIWFQVSLFAMICGYLWWATALEVPVGVAGGTALMFLGVIVAMGVAFDPKRVASLCVAIPAIIGGLLWPHLEYFQFWTLVWALFGSGMISSGLLMLRQLSVQILISGQELSLTSEKA